MKVNWGKDVEEKEDNISFSLELYLPYFPSYIQYQ